LWQGLKFSYVLLAGSGAGAGAGAGEGQGSPGVRRCHEGCVTRPGPRGAVFRNSLILENFLELPPMVC